MNMLTYRYPVTLALAKNVSVVASGNVRVILSATTIVSGLGSGSHPDMFSIEKTPAGPCIPCIPRIPCSPCRPRGPSGPLTPLGPLAYWSEKALAASVEAKIDRIIPATNKPFDIPFPSDNAILS